MPLCPTCTKERFIVYHRYQGIRIKPARCIGCILAFRPRGITNNTKDFLKYRPWIKVLNHAWVLVGQTRKEDTWFCPFCRKTLMSNKQGTPSSAGCMFGRVFRAKKEWYVDIKRIVRPKCPLCEEEASIVTVKRMIVKRPRKHFWPFTCYRCYQ